MLIEPLSALQKPKDFSSVVDQTSVFFLGGGDTQ